MKNHQITIKMNDDLITALAREYAEEIFKNDESNPDLSICLLNDIKFEAAVDFEEKLRFLLHRYCLVEKSKVENAYQRAKNAEKDGEDLKLPLLRRTGRIQRIVVESLFPGIGKEVEG